MSEVRLTARWYDDVFPPEVVEAQECYEQMMLCRRLQAAKLTKAQWDELRPRLKTMRANVEAHQHALEAYRARMSPIKAYLLQREDGTAIRNRTLWFNAVIKNLPAMAKGYAEAGEQIKQINAKRREEIGDRRLAERHYRAWLKEQRKNYQKKYRDKRKKAQCVPSTS